MALIQCTECGQMISDKAASCLKCGAPIEGAAQQQVAAAQTPINANTINTNRNGTGNLEIQWQGKYALMQTSIGISVNGQSLGKFSYNDGFSTTVPISSAEMVVELRCNGAKRTHELSLNPNENYVYKIMLGGWNGSGGFTYELYGSNGAVLKKKESFGCGMWVLCFLIPIVGIIYYFVNRADSPSKAQAALTVSLTSIGIGVLMWIFSWR
jgi:hypothetical protein